MGVWGRRYTPKQVSGIETSQRSIVRAQRCITMQNPFMSSIHLTLYLTPVLIDLNDAVARDKWGSWEREPRAELKLARKTDRVRDLLLSNHQPPGDSCYRPCLMSDGSFGACNWKCLTPSDPRTSVLYSISQRPFSLVRA